MRRPLQIACLLAGTAAPNALAPSAAAGDLTGRAILSYQTFDSGLFASDGFHQTYDLRFERAITDPFRVRLSLRAERDSGGSDFGFGSQPRSFHQLQPGGELLYSLPKLQLQANYDLIRLDSASGGLGTSDRRLERKTGRLSWRPDALPALTLQSEERGTSDVLAGLDRTERLQQATLDYAWKGLTVAATRRGNDIDDPGSGFVRRSRENQGLLNYDGSYFGGRLSASASGLVSSTRLDDTSQGRAATVPTPVPIVRASYVNDDSPLDSRDRAPVDVPALVDGDRERPTGISLGPAGASFQNLVVDLGRPGAPDLFRIHVRDPQGGLVRAGGPVSWDVYVSRDGVDWSLRPGARVAFLAALGAYEVRIDPVSSRFFKLVSFGTNTFETEVTEVEAFFETVLGPSEMRRTDMLLGSGSATVSVKPVERVTLGYYGIFNGLRQTSPDRPELTTQGFEHQVSGQLDATRTLSLIVRFQDRSLVQSGGLDDTFDSWTGIVHLSALRAADQTLEVLRSRENNLGRRIDTDGITLRTSTWLYPTLRITLDVGRQRQDFVDEGFNVDRTFLNGVGEAQITGRLRLMVTATIQHSNYQQGVEQLLPDLIGLPPARDERWTAELFYRAGSQLAAAVRLGKARSDGFTATLQRYHLDWYPFRGGAVALSGIYDQDVDSIGRRTARRLTLTPAWVVNRHLILNVNYTVLTVSGLGGTKTRTFLATATVSL
jgi:hypothetical protein